MFNDNINPPKGDNDEYDIAHEIFISNWPDWLRWALLVPATIIGVIIVPLLFGLLMFFGGRLNEGTSPGWWRIWINIVQSVITGATFVILPSYIAPKKQLVVSVIFLAISALFCGILLVLSLMLRETGGDKLYALFHIILALAGSGYAVYYIKEEA